MSVSPADLAAAKELFAPLGRAITHRFMMGGAILYADGAIFAAIMGDEGLHIRAKGALAERLAAAGSTQFRWQNPKTGKAQAMGYWSLPEAALDDPETACEWAQAALDAEE